MWYFLSSEGGELIPWCPEVVLYFVIQPGYIFIKPSPASSFYELPIRFKREVSTRFLLICVFNYCSAVFNHKISVVVFSASIVLIAYLSLY